MKKILRNRSLALLIVVLLIVGLLVIVFSVNKSTDTRSRAQAATTLQYSPVSTSSNPLKATIGTSLPLDIYITPNSNIVSYVLLELTYDPTYFDENSAVFVFDGMSSLSLREGPYYEPGKVTVSLDIGNDFNKTIKSKTRVGTLSLKPITKTSGKNSAIISFGSSTTILSIGSTNSTQENVLSGSTPAYVTIN